MNRAKRIFAAATASALLAGSAAGPAAAASPLPAGPAPGPAAAAATTQDGLVNVNVGNVNVARDVDVGVASNVAANVCGVAVGPVQALASNVDATNNVATVCTPGGQAVTLLQN